MEVITGMQLEMEDDESFNVVYTKSTETIKNGSDGKTVQSSFWLSIQCYAATVPAASYIHRFSSLPGYDTADLSDHQPTGWSEGKVYVRFETNQDALHAMTTLQGLELESGIHMYISFCETRRFVDDRDDLNAVQNRFEHLMRRDTASTASWLCMHFASNALLVEQTVRDVCKVYGTLSEVVMEDAGRQAFIKVRLFISFFFKCS